MTKQNRREDEIQDIFNRKETSRIVEGDENKIIENNNERGRKVTKKTVTTTTVTRTTKRSTSRKRVKGKRSLGDLDIPFACDQGESPSPRQASPSPNTPVEPPVPQWCQKSSQKAPEDRSSICLTSEIKCNKILDLKVKDPLTDSEVFKTPLDSLKASGGEPFIEKKGKKINESESQNLKLVTPQKSFENGGEVNSRDNCVKSHECRDQVKMQSQAEQAPKVRVVPILKQREDVIVSPKSNGLDDQDWPKILIVTHQKLATRKQSEDLLATKDDKISIFKWQIEIGLRATETRIFNAENVTMFGTSRLLTYNDRFDFEYSLHC